MKDSAIDYPPAIAWFHPPEGEYAQHHLHHRVFRSVIHDAWVGYTVFLHPTVLATRAPVPGICFLHGATGNESPGTGHVAMADALSKGIAAGTMPPCLMFWPNGGSGTQYEDFADGSLSVRRMFNEEWFPYLLRRYPIDQSQLHLQGMSMGGWGAVKFAIDGPGRFASVTSFGGALLNVEEQAAAPDTRTQRWQYSRIYNADPAYYRPRCIYRQAHQLSGDLHFFCGDADIVLPRNQAYCRLLDDLGIHHHPTIIPDCRHDMGDYHEHWLEHTVRMLEPGRQS